MLAAYELTYLAGRCKAVDREFVHFVVDVYNFVIGRSPLGIFWHPLLLLGPTLCSFWSSLCSPWTTWFPRRSPWSAQSYTLVFWQKMAFQFRANGFQVRCLRTKSGLRGSPPWWPAIPGRPQLPTPTSLAPREQMHTNSFLRMAAGSLR